MSFNVDNVRAAWESKAEKARDAFYAAQTPGIAPRQPAPDLGYVKEVWSDFVIVQKGWRVNSQLFKVPFSADEDGNITFDAPVAVKQEYIELSSPLWRASALDSLVLASKASRT